MKNSVMKSVLAIVFAVAIHLSLCPQGAGVCASAATTSSAQDQFKLDLQANINAEDDTVIDVVITVKDIQQELDAVEFDLHFDNSLVEGVITQNGEAEDGTNPMDAFMTVRPMYTLSMSGVEAQMPRYEQICRYDATAGVYECRFLDLLQYVSPKPGETYRGLINDGDLVITIPFKILDGVDATSDFVFTADDVKGTTRVGLNSVTGTGGSVAYQAEDPALVMPTITVGSPSVSFEGEIRYNIYFSASQLDDVTEMGLALFNTKVADGTVENADQVIPGYTGENGSYMVRTDGIAPKNMGDALYFRIYAKLTDGSYVYTAIRGYNAIVYANNILKNSTDANMRSLVVAMLNYGAAAQQSLNYKTDSLMNAGLTAEQRALVAPYDATMMDDIVAVDSVKAGLFTYNPAGFTSRKPSVSFDGSFAINYYFTSSYAPQNGMKMYYWTLADYNAADVLTAENATGSMDMTNLDGNQFWGHVEGIVAKNIDETVFVAAVYTYGGVECTTGVLPYSVGGYCEAMIAAGNQSMIPVCSGAAVYGYYAKQYFNSLYS